MVNDKLGVPMCERPSFEEVDSNYEQFRAKCTPLTNKQKTDNKGKGCIIPANGRPSRSVIKVVEFKPNETSNPTNPNPQEFPKSDDYIIISKTKLWILLAVIIIIICIASLLLLKQRHQK